jgi:phosphoglycerate dehydrogenase-like enzyme
MKQIFVDMPIEAAGLERLRSIPDVQLVFADPISSNAAIARPAKQVRDIQIAFCTFLPTNLSDMPQLEWVQLSSSGYEQVVGLNLTAKGVRACNARGVFDTAIAEWNVAMMVCLARNMRQMIRNQEARVWDQGAQFQTEIRGRKVGLWGYGGLGRQTARICKALGMTVHVLSRSGVGPRLNAYCVPDSSDTEGVLPDRVFRMEQKDEFLQELDFLVLCMPLTKATEGIVGVDELRALPSRAFLLNPARGPLVQERPLLQALNERWIAGAALDTHYQYPLPAEHPLWKIENVILTPHISGSSESPFYRLRTWDLFVQNVQRYISDQSLLNELSTSQLAGC